MKIFLDDVRPLPLAFQEEGGWTIVRTAQECMELIRATGLENIHALSLDNDLGQEIEGYQVVDWIEWLVRVDGNPPIRRWYVHSKNPVRAQYMHNIMSQLESIR